MHFKSCNLILLTSRRCLVPPYPLRFLIGTFPDILKIVKVTPFHKKDSKLDYINYRHISLLSAFSKIYENLIYSRSYQFLNENKLINTNQFGFRRNESTNHVLLNITERIKSLVDTGQYVCGIFIDLEKLLTQLIMKYYVKNLIIMVYVEM